MADLPTNITPGVTTGHATDHAALGAWLNQLGYDEGHQILNHTSFPGNAGQFLAGDGVFRVPGGGASGSPGFALGMGTIYLRAAGGSDANDGASPATAKATLAAAVSALPTAGGTIYASEGTHNLPAEVVLSRPVSLIGMGRRATKFKVTTSGIHGIRVTAPDCLLTNFAVTDSSDGSFGGTTSGIRGLSGIFMDGTQETLVHHVRVDSFGLGGAVGTTFDNGPAGIRVAGPTNFGDWNVIDDVVFRACNRGLALASGMNGYISHCSFYGAGNGERVFMRRRDNTPGRANEWRFASCWFAGGPTGGYQVSIDTETDAQAGNVHFMNCMSEVSAAAGGTNSYYVNVPDVSFTGCHFGFESGSGATVQCGPTGDVTVGNYTWTGTPSFRRNAGGVFRLWQPTDFTGAVTVN